MFYIELKFHDFDRIFRIFCEFILSGRLKTESWSFILFLSYNICFPFR